MNIHMATRLLWDKKRKKTDTEYMNARFLDCLLLWHSFRHTVHKYGFVDRYAADLAGHDLL